MQERDSTTSSLHGTCCVFTVSKRMKIHIYECLLSQLHRTESNNCTEELNTLN